MTEGTKSWLFGCHSIIHSYYVIKSWKILYKKYPKFWQMICILLHDIGYWGTDYLTNKSNEGHAELGAKIARSLFGDKGYYLILGHSSKAVKKHNIDFSKLEAPDDYSWIISSMLWLKWNHWVEGFNITSPESWKEAVKKNWESGERTKSSYDNFLKLNGGK